MKSLVICVVNLLFRYPSFTQGIGVLKRAENPSNSMSTLDDLRLYRTQEMLRWCVCVFKKIVVEHLNKSLKLHTLQRFRLKRSNRRKRPQFWQCDDWYLLHDNAPAYQSHLLKVFLTKIYTKVLPKPFLFTRLKPCNICLFPSMKEYLQGRGFVSLDEVRSIAVRKWFPAVLPEEILRLGQKCIVFQGDKFKGGCALVL
ncbi:hypothetical protein TNCV_401731 [Trichonephila clavipes]|nr:hypothetical protein TNCV_401731 [Trichonephila clavipes]